MEEPEHQAQVEEQPLVEPQTQARQKEPQALKQLKKRNQHRF